MEKPDESAPNESDSNNLTTDFPSYERTYEAWKESIGYARHWETLVFESAKHYFTVIAFSLAGAGVAVGWSSIDREIQQYVVAVFLALTLVLSLSALFTIKSQQSYLFGFYSRRKEIESKFPELQIRNSVEGAGDTIFLLKTGFFSSALVSIVLATILFVSERPSPLKGADLSGANLSMVKGLKSSNLIGACGDENTKLPEGLTIKPCK